MHRSHQKGVVLLVVLLLLLLTSLVVISAMETSDMEAKMAAARLGREVSFQATESAIDQAKNDGNGLVAAYVAGLDPNSPTQVDSYTFTGDADLVASVETRYVAEIPALGNDIVIGSPGLRSLHFDLLANVRRDDDATDDADHGADDDDRFDSTHQQGIKRFAPKLP